MPAFNYGQAGAKQDFQSSQRTMHERSSSSSVYSQKGGPPDWIIAEHSYPAAVSRSPKHVTSIVFIRASTR
ncbi:Hypothetical protein NCS54_01407200 [Fusarium falciforme]|uniref:Hypothetical protein n=1 Tax=Fusarium falciforme TaxID=195108 RepID=UPI0023000606|nr:Hypothetical protein NCS54_01407200 [Fusarium falciforme]WAO96399.1 Hypothetical protein NCS54_01407200 [Fusarium falciforme]